MTAFGVTSIAAQNVTTQPSYSKATATINAQPMIGAAPRSCGRQHGAKNTFRAFDHGLLGGIIHAGVPIRAAVEPAQIAGRTGQVGTHHRVFAMVGASPDGVAWAEQANHRAAKRDR